MPSSGLDTEDSSNKLLFGLRVVAEKPTLEKRRLNTEADDAQTEGAW